MKCKMQSSDKNTVYAGFMNDVHQGIELSTVNLGPIQSDTLKNFDSSLEV